MPTNSVNRLLLALTVLVYAYEHGENEDVTVLLQSAVLRAARRVRENALRHAEQFKSQEVSR